PDLAHPERLLLPRQLVRRIGVHEDIAWPDGSVGNLRERQRVDVVAEGQTLAADRVLAHVEPGDGEQVPDELRTGQPAGRHREVTPREPPQGLEPSVLHALRDELI